MNKKANEFNAMASIAIIIVTLIVLLLWLIPVHQKQKEFKSIESCRQSVDIQSQTKIKGIQFKQEDIAGTGLDCPTQKIVIAEKDPTLIQKKLANQMAYCWFKFGEGKKDLFDVLFNEEKNYCVVCSLVSFEGSAANIEIKGFLQFLESNPIPPFLGKQNYKKYISPYTTAEETQTIKTQQSTEDSIITKGNYAVLLLYAKKGYVNKMWSTPAGIGAGTVVGASTILIPGVGVFAATGYALLGTIAGGAIGYAAGNDKAADWSAATVLWPYSEQALQGLNCNELPAEQQTKLKIEEQNKK
ncbi:hypothetical protein HZA96_04110 [Candidatus Woesearchaeota archaeon]|nr:hypothetical protein [Candidatus Woesearchaeota archaeon]